MKVWRAATCGVVFLAGTVLSIAVYLILVLKFNSRALQALALPILGLLTIASMRICIVLTKRIVLGWTCIGLLLALAIVVSWFLVDSLVASARKIPSLDANGEAAACEIRDLVARGDYEQALKAAGEKALIDHPALLRDVAFAQNKLGRPEKARATYERAIQLTPGDLSARYELARLLETLDERAAAATEYERLLNINQDIPEIRLAYGVLLLRMERTDAAVEQLNAARALYPHASRGWIQVNELLGRIEEGRKE